MTGEMIAIITAAVALAALLVPGQRGMRSDIKKLLTTTSRTEGRLEGVEQRLGTVEQRLGTVEQRLGTVESEIAAARTEVARVETRLTMCIGKLEAELKERLARLEGYFEAMGAGGRATRKRPAK
ncbi:hypothetical protein [Candidatus Palauibacter sp.]|uniref:hypothetical protein n=1 Tax=Candidatus Palauibacter sp. TaxID=3101350 RepID=UPI003B52E92F